MILKTVLSFFLGTLLILAFEPFNFWVLAHIIPLLILVILNKNGSKDSFIIGYFFGLGFWFFGIFWIENSINIYGGASPIVSYVLTILLAAFLSIFQALSFFLYNFLKQENFFSRLMLFPSIWVIFEWLREFLLSGFPWLYLGYSALDNFLINGFIPIAGIFGTSFLIVFLSTLILEFSNSLKKLNSAYIIASSFLIAFVFLINANIKDIGWTKSTSEVDVVVVQPNIGIKEKWTPSGRRESTDIMGGLLLKESSRLIDEPETPKLFFFPEVFLPGKFSNFQFYIKPFLALTEKANIGVIAGTLSENEDKIYNSLISFGNLEGKYDKEVLVPFGEYVPYDFFNYFFNFFNFSRPEVSAAKNNSLIHGENFSIFASICYEVAYQDLFFKYASESNLLFTASNDAWFGKTIGPHQHLQIARFRASESRKPLIRSTTSGISAIIDEKGKVISFIKLDNELDKKNNFENLNQTIQFFSGSTPINSYGKIPFITVLLLILLGFCFLKFKNK